MSMDKEVFPAVNSEQADIIVQRVKQALGPHIAGMLTQYPLNINYLVRFMRIAQLCQARREEKGLSVKDIASQLKVPQYRLKDIEKNSMGSIKPDILDRYIEFLGLGEEFQKWLEANRDVYEGLGEQG